MPDQVATAGTEGVVKRSKENAKAPLRMVERVLFGACGTLLLIGFFMPWFIAGTAISMSGLSLVFASGDVVGMLAGANRFLLVAVPVLGVLLLGGSILGVRFTRWLAVGGSGAILLFGFIILIRLFISSTGLGMWLVILSAMLGLSIGLVGLGRIRASEASEP